MTHNQRPADFPTDAELAAAQPLTTLAALFDAFVGSDEWDEHDVRTQAKGTVAVVGDTLNGNPYWRLRITKHFDSGDMVDYAYTFGDVTTAAQYAVNVAAQRGFALEVTA